MAQPLARKRPNFLEVLAQNPHGWGPEGMASPEAGVRDPNAGDRAQNALRMFGPVAEAAVPYLPQKGREMADEAVAQAPYMAAGPVLGTAALVARAAPRAAAAAGGLILSAIPSAAGKEKPSPEVMKRQEKLRDAGYYKGKIDGLMKDETAKAQAEFDKAEEKRLKMETERKGVEAAIKETERKTAVERRRERERKEGSDRLKELDKGKSSFWDSYGTPITYGAGALAGAVTRGATTYLTNRAARKVARETDALVSGGGDLPSRVGGVNEFWAKGGASELPFTPAPKGRYGFTSNKKAPPAPTLYNEKPGNKYVRAGDVAATGIFGAEMGVSEWQKIGAREELKHAREAVSADPSEANIRRMKAAEDEYAFWEGMANAGRGAIGGYGAAGKFATYKNPRPGVAAADAERIRIDNTIHQARPIRRKK